MTVGLDGRSRPFTLAATGDTLVARRLPAVDTSLAELNAIMGASDARFTNLEVVLHDTTGYPAGKDAGTYCAVSPAVVHDLSALGFNMYSCANNHSMDWMYQGLLGTIDALDSAGACRAGIGRTLSEARAPHYLETAAGRVALVALTTTGPAFGRAADPRGDVPGRPGVNHLRHEVTYQLPAEFLSSLDTIRQELHLDAWQQLLVRLGFARPAADGGLRLFGHQFSAGAKFRTITGEHPGDLEANCRSIAHARRQADYVLVSIHSHEMKAGDEEASPEFLEHCARACIDAGAHAVLGHGPHLLRGIEIYNGYPIFYSLGNFLFESELMDKQPQDYFDKLGLPTEATASELFDLRAAGRGFPSDARYWESVLPICRFCDGRLQEIRIYPLSLGFGFSRPQRGRPALAPPPLGAKVIERLTNLSRSYGSQIAWRGNYGTVKLKNNPSNL